MAAKLGPDGIRPLGDEKGALRTGAQGRFHQPAPPRRAACHAQGRSREGQYADAAPDPHADRGATGEAGREGEAKDAAQAVAAGRAVGEAGGVRGAHASKRLGVKYSDTVNPNYSVTINPVNLYVIRLTEDRTKTPYRINASISLALLRRQSSDIEPSKFALLFLHHR